MADFLGGDFKQVLNLGKKFFGSEGIVDFDHEFVVTPSGVEFIKYKSFAPKGATTNYRMTR
jgi:hypothetical protein